MDQLPEVVVEGSRIDSIPSLGGENTNNYQTLFLDGGYVGTPSPEQQAIQPATCCDATDVVGGSLKGIKFGIGALGIIGGSKIVGKRALGNVKKPSADELRKMLGVSQEKFHREIKKEILRDFRKEISEFGIKNPDIALDKGNIVIIDVFKKGISIQTNIPLTNFRP